jgi:CheY-like chemotaxis protein
MPQKRVLIVEDETIVSEDLRGMLTGLGYAVVGVAATGDDALRLARAERPDLVLMDIHIQGAKDGIETAEALFTELDIPVSYLTAYADGPTLERAKATLPFGYILKPFDEQDLRTTIELALYRHQMEHLFVRENDWSTSALDGLPEVVMGIDGHRRIIYLNHAAQSLVGRPVTDFLGKPVETLFDVHEEEGRTLLALNAGDRKIQWEAQGSVVPEKTAGRGGAVLVLKRVP